MNASVILWADACQMGLGTWTDICQSTYPVLSCGIIAEEDSDTVHLSRDFDGQENSPWRGVIAIPKVLILERKDFKIPKCFTPRGDE